ncbi:MAG TPA: hypothetical protein ENJ00_07185 [Phycisphaerales bacterium]|nr:hypothetical protein [Phycisphaerales bacterium]
MSAWETNASIKEIADWLADKQRIVVLTHSRPDGDAVGSSLATVRSLNRATKTRRASVWYTGSTPWWLKELAGDAPYHALEGHDNIDIEPDAIVVVDTGSWKQLEGLADFVRNRTAITTVIDHHLNGDPDMAPRLHISKESAAAVQPVCQLATELLHLECPRDLPTNIAELIYAGLATDTGWFRHASVRPAVFRLAADLLDAGVDHAAIYALVEQHDRASRLRAMAAALATLELHDRDRIATMELTREAIHAAGAGPADTGGFSELGLKIASVRVSATLTEVETSKEDPATKISMRSKAGSNMVNVNLVAQALGGGGHANAAGAKLPYTIQESKRRLLDALEHATKATK